MAVIYILAGILFSAGGVLLWLFYSLKKQSIAALEENAVPVSSLEQIKTTVLPEVSLAVLPEEQIQNTVPASLAEDNTEVRLLKEEVKIIREKAVVQARSALEVINKISDENRFLRADITKLQQDAPVRTDEDLLMHLKAENSAFKTQMDAGNDRSAKLAEELDIVRRELGLQLSKASEVISRLEEENVRFKSQECSSAEQERVVADIRTEYQKQLEAFQQEINALKQSNEVIKLKPADGGAAAGNAAFTADAFEALKEDVAVLRQERSIQSSRIEDFEQSLRDEQEKNDFLRYELTKSRAQSVGIERICENARRQFEDKEREARGAEQDNATLKQQANVLEQSLKNFKRLNAELLKQEKLTQFELEHNRGQLKDLEHIYEVFRARLAGAGVSAEIPEQS